MHTKSCRSRRSIHRLADEFIQHICTRKIINKNVYLFLLRFLSFIRWYEVYFFFYTFTISFPDHFDLPSYSRPRYFAPIWELVSAYYSIVCPNRMYNNDRQFFQFGPILRYRRMIVSITVHIATSLMLNSGCLSIRDTQNYSNRMIWLVTVTILYNNDYCFNVNVDILDVRLPLSFLHNNRTPVYDLLCMYVCMCMYMNESND